MSPRAGGDTPAMKQYWAAKLAHPDAILLFRLGDFYEIFFQDAVEAAPIMGITLTSRPMRDGRQPMCGVLPADAVMTPRLTLGYRAAAADRLATRAPLADRLYVMEHGTIVESFGASQLQEKLPVLNELLGV